jgi:hypothetical protein
MMIIDVLNIVAPVALAVFLIGVGVRMGRFALALVTRRRFRGVTPTFERAPRRLGFFEALHAVLFGPYRHFYRRANPTWGRGYLFYHVAIITEVIGYTLSAIIVFAHILFGRPVPDVAHHLEGVSTTRQQICWRSSSAMVSRFKRTFSSAPSLRISWASPGSPSDLRLSATCT